MFWMDRPIEELSREELLGVVKHLAAELALHQTLEAISERALGKVEAWKKAALRANHADMMKRKN